MLKRIFLWIVSVFFMAALIFGADALLQQRRIADRTIRLHVVANSDSEADQQQKLQVRDVVLNEVKVLTADCGDREAALAVLSASLPRIQQAAQTVSGGYPIEVTLQNEDFDTRYYPTFTMPAGEYMALRVNIGAAQGHNWWCVVFPSLCTAAEGEGFTSCAASAGITEDDAALLTEGCQLKFQLLEWLEELKIKLRSR